ncbi:MAG: proline--tRNA ligase [Pseudomonadota bacterium]
MRQSQTLIPTMKEDPADADVISHRLMLRAGLIRQLASGLYTWLPLGVRVLRKIEQIIREELNRTGAQEISMPVVQPAQLWEESGRWQKMGDEMLRMQDRHERDFCLGPTHEEVVTDLFRREIQSYKQLPVNYYQIQTKFRDERRPRFGVMRAREFTMKDGYSFHADQESFDATYQAMYDSYAAILKRMDLDFRAVEADTGNIGGANSHEFHVLAESGEDTIAYATEGDYAANLERAVAAAPEKAPEPNQELTLVDTPDVRTIADLCQLLGISAEASVKTLVVHADEQHDTDLIAIVLRGDHELNEIKAAKLPGVANPLQFANDAEILAACGAKPGSLGPVHSNIPVLVDRDAAALADFACGANQEEKHFTGANWQRDCALSVAQIVDARNVVEGDLAIDGQGTLRFLRGIEVGHIFQLGTVYSTAMNANVLDQDGQMLPPIMGCYGMGVTRLVAAIIEQNHDENGIVWPAPVTPYDAHLIALNYHKSDTVRAAADDFYAACQNAGVDVLFDDRDDRPGAKFADADLIGLPARVVIGERGLKNSVVEFKARAGGEVEEISLSAALERLQS